MKNGIPEQTIANQGLIELSKNSLGLIATNDCHYLNADHAEAHNVLLCIQTGKTVEDNDRMSMASEQFYVRSSEEMQALFAATPEAISNTVSIAERCNLTLEFGKFYLPKFEVKILKNLLTNTWSARRLKGSKSSCPIF